MTKVNLKVLKFPLAVNKIDKFTQPLCMFVLIHFNENFFVILMRTPMKHFCALTEHFLLTIYLLL